MSNTVFSGGGASRPARNQDEYKREYEDSFAVIYNPTPSPEPLLDTPQDPKSLPDTPTDSVDEILPGQELASVELQFDTVLTIKELGAYAQQSCTEEKKESLPKDTKNAADGIRK